MLKKLFKSNFWKRIAYNRRSDIQIVVSHLNDGYILFDDVGMVGMECVNPDSAVKMYMLSTVRYPRWIRTKHCRYLFKDMKDAQPVIDEYYRTTSLNPNLFKRFENWVNGKA
jgi:hypothetical protein